MKLLGTGRPVLVSVLVGALVVVGGASIGAVLSRSADQAQGVRRAASEFTPPVLSTPSAAPLPVIAVIGDGAVNQSARGVNADSRWPAQLAESQQVRTAVLADSTSGYQVAGGNGRTFVDQASRVPTDAAVVLFVGGANDRAAEPLALVRAASDAIAAAKERAPSASVIVVGPIVSNRASAADLEQIGGVLENAADISGATWLDPIGQDWISGATRTSGSQLTEANERAIAGRIESVVQRRLNGLG